jgi:phage terminase large subunit GpA-like protein
MASTPLAWIDFNGFVNENQKRIEFHNHRFMIDVYADNHPDIVCIKSAQVGFSVYAILKSFHELKYEKRNILYALPTRNVVQDFVVPKVNPLITSNPAIAREVGDDSVSLKKLGDRFIYFKGGI